MKTLDLNGLIPATLTPMTQDYRVDEPALKKYIRWVIQHDGLKGVAINMDTGEGPHLTAGEKKRIVSIWRAEVGRSLPILAGVGGPSTADAIRDACSAAEAGADALVIFPIPAYAGRPLPPALPIEYHKSVAESVEIPIVLFQLQPSLGGVIFDADTLEQLLEIDSVIAIKEASFDTVTFAETVKLVAGASSEVMMLTGNDNFILESFLLGATGALVGFGTILIAEQIKMMHLANAGEYPKAMKIYREKVLPLARGIFAAPVRNYRARLKAAMKLMGVLDEAVMRPPLLALNESENQFVRDLLRQADLI
jgi:4-hydroxy-tetrahydrodipicolinate synthase